MAGITLKSILELANSNDAKPSTRISYRLGKIAVPVESVKLVFYKGGGYSDRSDEIEVQISDEFIDQLASERMKRMFDAHVDSMFAAKSNTTPTGRNNTGSLVEQTIHASCSARITGARSTRRGPTAV